MIVEIDNYDIQNIVHRTTNLAKVIDSYYFSSNLLFETKKDQNCSVVDTLDDTVHKKAILEECLALLNADFQEQLSTSYADSLPKEIEITENISVDDSFSTEEMTEIAFNPQDLNADIAEGFMPTNAFDAVSSDNTTEDATIITELEDIDSENEGIITAFTKEDDFDTEEDAFDTEEDAFDTEEGDFDTEDVVSDTLVDSVDEDDSDTEDLENELDDVDIEFEDMFSENVDAIASSEIETVETTAKPPPSKPQARAETVETTTQINNTEVKIPLRTFIKNHPFITIEEVLKYYTEKELKIELQRGYILKKKNTLFTV